MTTPDDPEVDALKRELERFAEDVERANKSAAESMEAMYVLLFDHLITLGWGDLAQGETRH